MAFDIIDSQIVTFEQSLSTVMKKLEKNLIDLVGSSATAQQLFDANVLLNSEATMITALQDAGYFSLAEEHISAFAKIPAAVKASYAAEGFPLVEFTALQKADMTALAQMNLEQFNNIGVSAMNELRLGLVQNAVSALPLSSMVDAVAAATVGVAANGSPLSNYAATHARTAINTFNGEVNIKAAESFGHDKPTDRWRVRGPNDAKTRDVCSKALTEPIRTRQEWEDAGYFGGSPGGWNCRHRFRPIND